jgi:hypothetical protein
MGVNLVDSRDGPCKLGVLDMGGGAAREHEGSDFKLKRVQVTAESPHTSYDRLVLLVSFAGRDV